MEEALAMGNVGRRRWPVAIERRVPLYLGSGRFGACFDVWGLMRPRDGGGAGTGETVLMHADHVHRGAHGAERFLPLARLTWADGPPPTPPSTYFQDLDLGRGRLETRLVWPGLDVTFAAQFHPGRRDVLGVEVSYESSGDAVLPALLLAPETPAEL